MRHDARPQRHPLQYPGGRMRRAATLPLALLSGLLLAACADDRPTPTAPVGPPGRVNDIIVTTTDTRGQPVGGLSSTEFASFTRGQAQFERTFTQAGGLGPIFNASSCSECHGEEEGPVGGT